MSLLGAAPLYEDRSPRYPGAEEIRMVRAIARHGVRLAANQGMYRATFHGFRVRATRHGRASGLDGLIEVSVAVCFGRCVIEQATVLAADTIFAEPRSLAEVIAER